MVAMQSLCSTSPRAVKHWHAARKVLWLQAVQIHSRFVHQLLHCLLVLLHAGGRLRLLCCSCSHFPGLVHQCIVHGVERPHASFLEQDLEVVRGQPPAGATPLYSWPHLTCMHGSTGGVPQGDHTHKSHREFNSVPGNGCIRPLAACCAVCAAMKLAVGLLL